MPLLGGGALFSITQVLSLVEGGVTVLVLVNKAVWAVEVEMRVEAPCGASGGACVTLAGKVVG